MEFAAEYIMYRDCLLTVYFCFTPLYITPDIVLFWSRWSCRSLSVNKSLYENIYLSKPSCMLPLCCSDRLATFFKFFNKCFFIIQRRSNFQNSLTLDGAFIYLKHYCLIIAEIVASFTLYFVRVGTKSWPQQNGSSQVSFRC